jgi:ribosome recycling factor
MNLDKVLSISGKHGLYELISRSKGGFIVKSMESGKKTAVSMRHNINVLGEIAIYTYDDEIPLYNVFNNIAEKESKGKTIDPKSSSNELKSYFKDVLPEYDEERVYVSNIKKVLQWYNSLIDLGISEFEAEKAQEREEER